MKTVLKQVYVDLNDPKSRRALWKAIKAIEVLEKQKLRDRGLSINPVDWLEGLITRLVRTILKDPQPKQG